MPPSIISSTGSDHGTVTVSSISSFDPERDATVSSKLNTDYSHKLPELRSASRKYGRWNPRPAPDYVINTSAIGRAFPNFSQAGSPDSTSSSSFSVEIGRAKPSIINDNIRSPLTNINNNDHRSDSLLEISNNQYLQSDTLNGLRNGARPDSRNSTSWKKTKSSKKYTTFLQRQAAAEALQSQKENIQPTTQTWISQRSREEMQPFVADDSEFSITRTKNSRFTSQQPFVFASPNVSSKRQPSEPVPIASGVAAKAATSLEKSVAKPRVISQTVIPPHSYAANGTTLNHTQHSFAIPNATSDTTSATLNNGVPIIVEGGLVHNRRSSQAFVDFASYAPVHSIAIPEEEEKIYLLIEVLKGRIARVEAENEELKGVRIEHDRLTSQYEGLSKSHENLKESHEKLATCIQEIKESNRQLNLNNQQLRETNQQLDGFSQEISDMRESNKQLNIEKEEMRRLNSQLDNQIKELKESEKKSSIQNQQIQNMREVNEQLDMENQELREFHEELRNENDRLGAYSLEVESRIRRLQSRSSHSVAQQKVTETRNAQTAQGQSIHKNTHKPFKSVSDYQRLLEGRDVRSAEVRGARVPSHHASNKVSINDKRTTASSRDHPVLSSAARDVLDSLCPDHNAENCVLCTRVTSFGNNTSGGAPIRTAQPIRVSQRMPVAKPHEDEPTIRPAVEPGLALATVIKGLQDEIEHLKMKQSEVQKRYQSLDASLGKRERRRVGKELESIFQQLEFKSDQLYGLYDTLEGIRSQ